LHEKKRGKSMKIIAGPVDTIKLDLTDPQVRRTAVKFMKAYVQRVDASLSSEDNLKSLLKDTADNLRLAEKGAKWELRQMMRALTKEKKRLRGEFRNEITAYRKSRHVLEQAISRQETKEPAGEAP